MTALLLLAAVTAGRPNLVVIVADDLGWRDLSCYGSTLYETPNIDRLASQGLRFTHAFTSSPLCSPTRASLLTGHHVARHGITTPACHVPQVRLEATLPDRAAPSQRVVQPNTATRLPHETTTYAEVLRDAGYATAFMGKWHLGLTPYTPEHHGFDVVWGGRGAPGPPGGYFSPWTPKGDQAAFMPDVPAGKHIDDAMTDKAVEFLRSQADADGPFLLNYWMYSVHAPFEAKPDLIAKHAARIAGGVGGPQRSPLMAAMIETMDANVGRLLDEVDRLGMADDTLVLFTSDNGGNEYNLIDGIQVTDNAPLRNGKGNVHDGGVRVPLIVRWPGRVDAGTETAAVASSVDVFPTLVDAAGLSQDGMSLDGESLTPVFGGGDAAGRVAFTHFPHGPPATGSRPATSIHRGDWKLTRFFGDGDEQSDRHALYDLSTDVGEASDLSQTAPEVVAELAAVLDDHLAATGAPVPSANPQWDSPHDGWNAGEDTALSLNRINGWLHVESIGNDPRLHADGLRAKRGPVRVELRWRRTGTGEARLYHAAAKQGFARERSVELNPPVDGWATQTVTFESDKPVGRLRLDPMSSPGTAEIDWVRVIDDQGGGRSRVAKHWDF